MDVRNSKSSYARTPNVPQRNYPNLASLMTFALCMGISSLAASQTPYPPGVRFQKAENLTPSQLEFLNEGSQGTLPQVVPNSNCTFPANPNQAVNIEVVPSAQVNLTRDTCWVAIGLTIGEKASIKTNGHQLELRVYSLNVGNKANIESFDKPASPGRCQPSPSQHGKSFPRTSNDTSAAATGTNGNPGGNGSPGCHAANSAATPRIPEAIELYIHDKVTGDVVIRNEGENGVNGQDGGIGGDGGNGQQGGRSVTKRVLGACTCDAGPGWGGVGGNAGDGGNAGFPFSGGDGGNIYVTAQGNTANFEVAVSVLGGIAGAPGEPGQPGAIGFGGYGGRGSCGCSGAVHERKGATGELGKVGKPSKLFTEVNLLCDLRGDSGKHNLDGTPFFSGEDIRAQCRSYCDIPPSVIDDTPARIDPDVFAKKQLVRFWSRLQSALQDNYQIDMRFIVNKNDNVSVVIEDPHLLLASKTDYASILPHLIKRYIEEGLTGKYQNCNSVDDKNLYNCCNGSSSMPTPTAMCVRSLAKSSDGVNRAGARMLGLYLVAKELARKSIFLSEVEITEGRFDDHMSLLDWGNGIYTPANAITFQDLAYIYANIKGIDFDAGLVCKRSGRLEMGKFDYDAYKYRRSAGVLSIGSLLDLLDPNGGSDESGMGSGFRFGASETAGILTLSPRPEIRSSYPDTNNLCHVFDRLSEAMPTGILSCFTKSNLTKRFELQNLRAWLSMPSTGIVLTSLWFIEGLSNE